MHKTTILIAIMFDYRLRYTQALTRQLGHAPLRPSTEKN